MKVAINEHFASIEFHSEKANSFSRQMLSELAQAINTSQKQAKIILLKSAGDRTFSAGASFDEFKKISNKTEAIAFFSGFLEVLDAIRSSSCPVLCRVQGKAVGGAVGIIAACDYVFAHRSAEVKLSEIELGIGPFTISPALERKIGSARFSEMLLDSSWKSPSWAQQAGLFARVYDKIEELDRAVDLLIEQLSKQSKATILENKRLLWAGTENWPELMKKRIDIVADLLINSKK